MTAKSLGMCFLPRLAHAIEMLVLGYPDIYGPEKEEDDEDDVSSSNSSSGANGSLNNEGDDNDADDVRKASPTIASESDPDADSTFSAPLQL